MAFEKGNTLGAKSRVFGDTMRRAIAQDDGKRVRDGVEMLLDKAAEGERWALEMVRDTLDGKPKQQVEVSGDEDSPLAFQVIRRVIVKPDEQS